VNRNDRAITALVMLAHGMVHTYELSIPIFVTIWLDAYTTIDLGVASVGVTEATLGVVVTAGYALFGLGALPGGILVDRVGSRRLIVACLFGMAGSFLLLALAPGLVAVAVALLVWGASASVYHPAGLALISKGVDDRGTGFAYHGIAGNVGIGLGPLATTVLLLVFDWGTVAAVLAIPAVVAGIYATRARFDETAAVPATDGGEAGSAADGTADDDGDGRASAGVDSFAEFRTASARLFAGGFLAVFVVVICSGLYYRGVLTFLPELLRGFPGFEPVPLAAVLPGVEAAAGRTLQPQNYVYSGLLLVGVVGQYVGGKLTDRVPVEYGIVGAFALLAVLALAFLPLAALGVGPLLAAGAVLGVALFVVQPFYQATVAEYTPAGSRGLSYGYTYLGVFGVGALGGAVAGGILAFATPAVLFATLAGFATVATLAGVYLVRRGASPTA
jgi:MFS family permease